MLLTKERANKTESREENVICLTFSIHFALRFANQAIFQKKKNRYMSKIEIIKAHVHFYAKAILKRSRIKTSIRTINQVINGLYIHIYHCCKLCLKNY